MTLPRRRGLRRWAVLAACLLGSATVLTGSFAAHGTTAPLRVLQMNLCDSGIAPCYSHGRSVITAASVIEADAPDVVTLNEVCQSDVYALGQALTSVAHGADVVSTFKAAGNRVTGGPYMCLNGEPYGIGLLVRVPPDRAHSTYSGLYPARDQDLSDPEERAWVCVYTTGAFYACATHLANLSPAAALAQCNYLLNTAIPAVRIRAGGYEPTVLGGDLNLRPGGSPDLRSCVPHGYLRQGDGAVQDIVATVDFSVASSQSISLDGTTDHPGLLVSLLASGG